LAPRDLLNDAEIFALSYQGIIRAGHLLDNLQHLFCGDNGTTVLALAVQRHHLAVELLPLLPLRMSGQAYGENKQQRDPARHHPSNTILFNQLKLFNNISDLLI